MEGKKSMGKISYADVSRAIFSYLNAGIKSFVIYPFGEKGKMVKRILNDEYSIEEIAVADNYLSKSNKEILSLNDLVDIQEKYVILLASDNEEVYNDVRTILEGKKLCAKVCDLAQISENSGENNGFNGVGGKLNIIECDSRQIKCIFEETRKAWKKLGEEEPYWSVLTSDEYKSKHIDEQTIQKFFLSGVSEAQGIAMTLMRNRAVQKYSDLRKLSILEIGCGCGRVTKNLANWFERIEAVDISKGNLKIAMQNVTAENVNFRLMESVEDYRNLAKSDVAYSCLVLQHNCPPVIEYLIGAMFDALNNEGIAIFQVPTYRSNYSFEYDSYIGKEHGMEMHVLPQQKIFELAHMHKCRPLEVYQHDRTDLNDNSMMFVFQKE